MQDFTTGAGLAAMGFWLFIAFIVVAGVWDNIRKRDAQHETPRRAIESGNPIDEELTDKLLALTGHHGKDLSRDLKVSGLILLPIAVGFAILGWAMACFLSAELIFIALGVAPLVGCVALGLLIAAWVAAGWDRDETRSDAV